MVRLIFAFLLATAVKSSSLPRDQLPGLATPESDFTPAEDSGNGVLPRTLRSRATCNPGQYLLGNTCRTCTAGYYCPDGNARYTCPVGTYSPRGATQCTSCPFGTYASSIGTANSCTDVSPGYRANASSGATIQIACGIGNWSPGSTNACNSCPPGSYCPSVTTGSPTPCPAGRYASTTGYGLSCDACPAGTFNNISGSVSCCQCCSGFFNPLLGQTSCQACPTVNGVKQGSPPGSTYSSACSSSLTDYVTTCAQTTSTCPKTQETGVSPRARRRRGINVCDKNEKRCPLSIHPTNLRSFTLRDVLGPYECIDVQTNLESCGGCVPEGEERGPDGGRDCTAIRGADGLECRDGRCLIHSCKKGYRRSDDGESCEKVGLTSQRNISL